MEYYFKQTITTKNGQSITSDQSQLKNAKVDTLSKFKDAIGEKNSTIIAGKEYQYIITDANGKPQDNGDLFIHVKGKEI